MEKALQAVNVSFSYNEGLSVIENINLSIDDNEFVAVIGKNGSGKTTLIKNFTGLLRPSSGEIFIRGKNARTMSVPEIAARIGFVMQNPDHQLFSETVSEEVAFALKQAKLPAGEISRRVTEALSACALCGVKDSFPPALGRGDRAKVIIAAVLAMGPRILIFDEPAGGQDYRNCRMIMDIAADLHRKGHTIIFVTHNMSMAAHYAKRIIVMDSKRIVMDGTPREIFCTQEGNPFVTPPQITRLSRELQKTLPLPEIALTVPSLGEMLLEN
ncbi:MAG: energy-coupling factor ABC transporter ATP-binding protein [Treponema sp.]|nr:energy-coupling factor ABC transporter ATP-binding protein [Treponema sp.]